MAKHKKVGFDKIGAMFALSQIGRKRNKGKGVNRHEKRFYLCPVCGKYHLTSQEYKEIK